MSLRKNVPYADVYDDKTNTLIYEDHDVPSNIADSPKIVDQPFSEGGTSLIAANVRILCMKCNLNKSNKILFIPPIFAC